MSCHWLDLVCNVGALIFGEPGPPQPGPLPPQPASTITIEAIEAAVNPPMYPNGYQAAELYRVRVLFGSAETLRDEDLYSLGGDAPRVQLVDEFGRWVALETEGGQDVDDGSFWDYAMKPVEEGMNRQPEYIAIEANQEDPICIAAITVSTPEGAETTVTGDLLHRECGWPGYASAASLTIGETTLNPFCLWLGSTGTKEPNSPSTIGQWATLHLHSFKGKAAAVAYASDMDLLCESPPRAWRWGHSSPRFPIFYPPVTFPDGLLDVNGTSRGKANTAYKKEVVNNPDHWVTSDRANTPSFEPLTGIPELGLPRNDTRRRDAGLESASGFDYSVITKMHRGKFSIVNSTSWLYSAEAKCKVHAFVGPDWANIHERKYCDLETRTVYPFCDTDEQEVCFDFDGKEREIRGARRPPSHLSAAVAWLWSEDPASEKPSPIKKLHAVHYDFGFMR